MIDIKQILEIIIREPLKYNLRCREWMNELGIEFSDSLYHYSISIYDYGIIFYILKEYGNRIGKNIKIEYEDPIIKAEINLLAKKVVFICEDLINNLANEFITNNTIKSNGIDD